MGKEVFDKNRCVCLLTGKPGSGKTILIKRILSETKLNAGGFYTEEIRVNNQRQGFKIVTLNGKDGILAHVNISGPYKVGKYGVNLEALEQIVVPVIRQAIQKNELIIIDEIGRMELFSSSFKDAVIEAMQCGKPVLGTIMLKPHPWADGIKRLKQVNIVLLTPAEWDETVQQILQWLDFWKVRVREKF
ncbi:MAG: NTPase [Nitrospirota bacterium]